MLCRNGSHISTQAASIPASLPGAQLLLRRTRPGSPSSAPARTTAARRSPDCSPRSETSASSPDGSHPRPSVAAPVSVAAPPNAPDIANRWPAPCLPPSRTARATCRAAALSQASPTASSNRLLNGALLGNCATFSVLIPQSGQRKRYNSTTTVVRYSKHGKSRTSRSTDLVRSAAPFVHNRSTPAVARLAAHPQLQRLRLLVDLCSIYPIARPSQNPRPVAVSQSRSLSKPLPRDSSACPSLCQIPAESPKMREGSPSLCSSACFFSCSSISAASSLVKTKTGATHIPSASSETRSLSEHSAFSGLQEPPPGRLPHRP